jgi:hypothetical protein
MATIRQDKFLQRSRLSRRRWNTTTTRPDGQEDSMKRRRHTPEQIVRKLREADQLLAEGREVPEAARTPEGTRR